MQVQTTTDNNVTPDRVNDHLRTVKTRLWSTDYGSEIRLDHPQRLRDLSTDRSITTTVTRHRWNPRCTELPQKKHCYNRQSGDSIRRALKETEQQSEPKIAVVDVENNIVDLVRPQKIAQHAPVRDKSDSHNATNLSMAVVVLATLSMTCRSNARDESSLTA